MTEAEFYVRDTGIGIDPEDLDKVFFIFRRGKNTAQSNVVAAKASGWRASRASSKRTTEKSGCHEQAVGEGSTFRFTINGMHLADGIGIDRPNSGGRRGGRIGQPTAFTCGGSVGGKMSAGIRRSNLSLACRRRGWFAHDARRPADHDPAGRRRSGLPHACS